MMPRSEPQRSCLGCRSVHDKRDLLRFVLDPENNLVPDILFKLPGRGAYTCWNADCLKAALAKNQFMRAFRGDVRLLTAIEFIRNLIELQERHLSSKLALANKAGQVISGSESVTEAIRLGNVGIVIVASDISIESKEKFAGLAARYSVQLQVLLDKERLGRLLGKELRSVVAVEKGKFAELISRGLDRYRNFC